MQQKTLSKNDLENLSKLPDNIWFEDIDVWPEVKRTKYSLERLIDAGYVEKKYSNMSMRYRKINFVTN